MRLPSLLLVLLGLTQCHHGTPAPTPAPDPLSLLPPETQTGARTFGCLVNGQAYTTVTSIQSNGDWQNINDIFISGSTRKDAEFNGDSFSIGMLLHGTLQTGLTQTFKLVSTDILSNKIYNVFTASATSLTGPCDYRGKYIKTGQVTLTKFDGVARIAAGRFAFTLYQPGGCDTLHVTNGRFDVKF